MSWKQVMIGIWLGLGVTVASESRSHLDSNSVSATSTNQHVNNLLQSTNRTTPDWEINVEGGKWSNIRDVENACGPQWYGWNSPRIQWSTGSISTTLYKSSKCGKLNFGNCWDSGTVKVYLAGKLIGEAGPNTPRRLIEFAITENSLLEIKDEGQNSVIKFTYFEMVDCSGPLTEEVRLNQQLTEDFGDEDRIGFTTAQLVNWLKDKRSKFDADCIQSGTCNQDDLNWSILSEVRLKDEKFPEVFLNGIWSPICGHWFWDNDYGAKLFCQKLTSNPDSTGNVIRRTDKPLESDGIRIGKCLSNDQWLSCSGGCNDLGTGQGCNNIDNCGADSPASIEIQCSDGQCQRPSSGCTASFDIYKSVDCDGDGILDHACSTTVNNNRWLVLSSEGCPSNWGPASRPVSKCPQAFEGNKTLEWVEEIRERMSQKLQGYNQKLAAFGSSMIETLEELTNALELEDNAVEVIEKICSKKGVTQIGKVIKCGRNCGTWNYENYSRTRDRSLLRTITCPSTSCSLHCNQVSSCQVMTAHESTWMIECSETSTCQSLKAKCTEGKTCFAKCSGASSCQGAVWTGNWLVECSGPSSC